MSRLGHNNPPIALDPKETIKKNINRRKLIVDCELCFRGDSSRR